MTSITTDRQRFEKRVRDDAQTWRDRLIGKRIVTTDAHIAALDGWKSTDMAIWEPRAYFCQSIGEGIDKDLKFEPQIESRLLRLPAEIRNHILEYVLLQKTTSQESEAGGMKQGDAVWINKSAVIFTCKQLYAEGRALAVTKHTFSFENFPKDTLFAAMGLEEEYVWDHLNVICDTKTNVIKQVYYG